MEGRLVPRLISFFRMWEERGNEPGDEATFHAAERAWVLGYMEGTWLLTWEHNDKQVSVFLMMFQSYSSNLLQALSL